MQPPPRTAPPGAVGPPPPSTGVPNAFRRPRAHKHPGSAIVMPGPTQPVIPMTDPFAFGLQAPSAVPTASHPPTSNSSPLPMQTPPPASFLQTVPAQSQSPQLQEGAQAPHSVPLVSSLSSQTTGGNTLTPNIVGSSAPPPYTFLAQNYFSQNCTALDPCFNQPQQEQFYHQMAGGPSSQRHESAHSPQVNPPSHTGPTSYVTDPGTVSMFFKENDVENEETLTGERKAVNGVPSGDLAMPYLNDSGFIGGSPKLEGSQFDHVENLECVPNQEVLPNEPHKTPLLPQNVGENLMTGQGSATVQGGGHFETGPNLETPDSVPRPARPESVSSGYSNVSHGSVSGARRPQGVVGTFIQQEVPRLSEDSSAGYFEQIDTSPAVEAVPQNAQPRVGHGQPSQPLTPSPPKPTGIFQASANSSFEPVHSHSVGVKPFEVDQARMVAEKNGSGLARVSVPDISPGNLEQPPDNMENIFMAPMHHPGGVPPERRPSSRAHGARLKCESPATTLWAQTELPVVGTNIMLAPAAPPVLGPLKQPSTEVIQPPEDGPLDLQATQADPQSFQKPNNSMENLENPPKLGETGAKSPQASLGYASLLVPSPAAESFQNQPILIAPPATNYNVIPPNNSTPVAYQMVCNESVQNPLPVHQSSESTANTASVVPQKTNHLEHFASSDNSSETLSGRPAVNHSPLDLAPESRHIQKSDIPPITSTAGSSNPPFSRPDLLGCPNHSAPSVSSHPPPAADNHKRLTNYELLDFTMHQPQNSQNSSSATGVPSGVFQQAPPPAPGSKQQGPVSNASDFYRQVTKDAQQERWPENEPQQSCDSGHTMRPAPDSSQRPGMQSGLLVKVQGLYQVLCGVHLSLSNIGYDQRYIQYEGANPGYRDAERYQPREQPERSSSRASQYSDRPSSRSVPLKVLFHLYLKVLVDSLDMRYHLSNCRPEGYNDPWRYDPRYDASFDEDYGRQRDPYGDEYDRRSVHSEHSAHSVRTSHSQHSRRSSFSSRSQQSQVSRSQQDLVSAPFDPPSQPSLPMVYPNNVDGYQYPADYYGGGGWPAMEQMPPRPLTPEKYTVPHRCARFGPAGQMVQVLPNLPSAGQPTLVEIYSIESMLEKTEEQKELCSFPGPLVKDETHKVDVIKFAQNKSLESLHNDSLIDKDSAQLIWEFIVLLCRQNGTVVGTDIADLLLREHKSVWLPGKSPNEANLIDFNKEPLERPDDEPGSGPLSLLSDTFMSVPDSVGKETERFRELLLFGRKKDALESAMKNGLWGHALLLASKMDNRTHARVMTRFANSLPINDPLQTVYQLMSGRMPASATCCGDEKWGDWRPHLAMVLSNLTHTLDLDTRTITTMGDTLASKGLIDAAHFCYMMAQVGLGIYTKKSTKMVLIGSNHSLPFFKFASNEAIQRTEAYEYAQSLGSQPCSLPNFQVFKFIYACRLAEAGLCAQAFQYCEVIARSLLSLPSYHSPVFISQLIQISAKLRFFDPQLKEKPEQELFIEPDWLLQLRQLDSQIRVSTEYYCWHNKPPPPPPTCFPKAAPQMGPGAPPTSGPQVNMFSRKAGTKSRYVDVLNPGGSSSKLSGSVPPPADLFAPLAPMPMPANLFVPGGDEQQPMEGSVPDASGSQGQGLPNPSTAAQVSLPFFLVTSANFE
uniref:Protein transport protein sec16 n=1 Tax=Scleropages formosus TaxID=113540 RepID=A0A8C9VHI1_SCLFO